MISRFEIDDSLVASAGRASMRSGDAHASLGVGKACGGVTSKPRKSASLSQEMRVGGQASVIAQRLGVDVVRRFNCMFL